MDQLLEVDSNRMPILMHMIDRFPNEWKNLSDRVLSDPQFEHEDAGALEIAFSRGAHRSNVIELLEQGDYPLVYHAFRSFGVDLQRKLREWASARYVIISLPCVNLNQPTAVTDSSRCIEPFRV